MSEPQIDWVGASSDRARDRAERRTRRGMSRAAQHAEQKNAAWADRALSELRRFVRQRRGAPFLTEDFREWARYRLPAPPTARAYGPVMQAAARSGLVRSVGYGLANSSNRSPKVQWEGA